MTFKEWIETESGKKCNTLPVQQPYLYNRLWRAFESGVESGEHDRRLQQTIEWYELKLRELKSRNRKLVQELNALKKDAVPSTD